MTHLKGKFSYNDVSLPKMMSVYHVEDKLNPYNDIS